MSDLDVLYDAPSPEFAIYSRGLLDVTPFVQLISVLKLEYCQKEANVWSQRVHDLELAVWKVMSSRRPATGIRPWDAIDELLAEYRRIKKQLKNNVSSEVSDALAYAESISIASLGKYAYNARDECI